MTTYYFIPNIAPSEKIHQEGKPILLYEAIIEVITLLVEVVVDSYVGSGNLGKDCLNKVRFAIIYELFKENVDRIVTRLQAYELSKSDSKDTSKKMSYK